MDLDADQTGVLVQEVMPGSPADQAGLRGSNTPLEINGEQILIGGDVITALDKKAVESIEDLVALLREAQPGQEVTLSILRDGRPMTLVVTLGQSN
jgi:S1-C subfamily serine protease